MLKKAVLSFLLIVMVSQLGEQAPMAAQSSIPQPAPGQMWSIKASSPTTAKIIVGRIESWGGTRVVHVSLIDVPIPGGLAGAGRTTTIGHMPFDESSFAASVDRLLATNVPADPGFENGYNQWRDAKGGIFTISIEEAIETVFQALTHGRN